MITSHNYRETLDKIPQGEEAAFLETLPERFFEGRSVLGHFIIRKEYQLAHTLLARLTPTLALGILSQKDDIGCTALHLAAVADDPTLYKDMKRLIGKHNIHFPSFAESPSLLRRIARLSKKSLPCTFAKITPNQLLDMWRDYSLSRKDTSRSTEYSQHVDQLASGKSSLKAHLHAESCRGVVTLETRATSSIAPNEMITEMGGSYVQYSEHADSRFLIEIENSHLHNLMLDKSEDVGVASKTAPGFINAYLQSVMHLGREAVVLRALPNVTIQPGEMICVDPGHHYFEDKPLPEERRLDALKAFLEQHDINEYFILLRKVSFNTITLQQQGLLRQWKYIIESNPVNFLKHLLSGVISLDTAEKLLTHVTERSSWEYSHGLKNFVSCVPEDLLSHCIVLARCNPERAQKTATLLVKRRYTMVSFPGALAHFLATHSVKEYLNRCQQERYKFQESTLFELWDSIWTDHSEEFLTLVRDGTVSQEDAWLLHDQAFGYGVLYDAPHLAALKTLKKRLYAILYVPTQPPPTL